MKTYIFQQYTHTLVCMYVNVSKDEKIKLSPTSTHIYYSYNTLVHMYALCTILHTIINISQEFNLTWETSKRAHHKSNNCIFYWCILVVHRFTTGTRVRIPREIVTATVSIFAQYPSECSIHTHAACKTQQIAHAHLCNTYNNNGTRAIRSRSWMRLIFETRRIFVSFDLLNVDRPRSGPLCD